MLIFNEPDPKIFGL